MGGSTPQPPVICTQHTYFPVQAIATVASHHRLGHATLLVSEVESWLSENGVSRVVAAVPSANNSGSKFFTKLDYKPLDLAVLAVSARCWTLFLGSCSGRRSLL